MTRIDLSQYPAPEVLETLDYELILGELQEEFLQRFPIEEAAAAEAGLPSRSQMERLLQQDSLLTSKALQATASHAIRMRARVNDEAKSHLLAYAFGTTLDHKGVDYGVVRHPGETDTDLRERIVVAINSFRAAGTRGYYWSVAKAAHADVKDVGFPVAERGQIRIAVLSRQGDGRPSSDLLLTVDQSLQPEDVKGATAEIITQPAEIIEYEISARIWCRSNVDTELVRSEAAKMAQAYADENHKLDHDIAISGLDRALHQPGVQRAELDLPSGGLVVGPGQAAFCTGVSVTFEGIDV